MKIEFYEPRVVLQEAHCEPFLTKSFHMTTGRLIVSACYRYDGGKV